MEIILVLGVIFIFMFILYVAVSFFLPEWVGITGNKAKDVMEHQQGSDDPPPPSVL
jgi:lipopolysaccharide export LptBFGC system permease protein LptF